jgi:crotonobetainyl-CoA:carnitine CoA-transferase CaiB-like acyl-CoA transferase
MSTAPRQGLLAGLTILDLSMFVAGPFATMILADLGARVIKIEPLSGDPTRTNRMGPQLRGESAQFASYNRNKLSLALDLKAEAGLGVFEDLVRLADAVFDNFRPGVRRRLKLDHERLRALNPRLVSVSISGFGQDGPWAQRPAYDIVVQALSGGMSLNGHAETGPAHIPYHLGDTAGGLYGAIGLLAAVHEARRTGRGRHIDVAMLDAQLALLGDEVTCYFASGEVPRQHGAGHPQLAPYQAFAAADAPLVVAAVAVDKFWIALCAAIGEPQLAVDPRFKDNRARVANHAELARTIGAALKTKSRAEWLAVLEAADVPAAPVLDVAEAVATPQATHRGVVAAIEATAGPPAMVTHTPIKALGEPYPSARPAPRLGEQGDEILGSLLGYPPDRIAALKRDRVVG